VLKVLNLVEKDGIALFIEPAAGGGAFIKPLLEAGYEVKAFDIEPHFSGITKQDFYEVEISRPTKGKVVSIRNPPFGFSSNNAIRFFNKCSEFSDYIAFILPKTFKKASVQNKLNRNFH